MAFLDVMQACSRDVEKLRPPGGYGPPTRDRSFYAGIEASVLVRLETAATDTGLTDTEARLVDEALDAIRDPVNDEDIGDVLLRVTEQWPGADPNVSAQVLLGATDR